MIKTLTEEDHQKLRLRIKAIEDWLNDYYKKLLNDPNFVASTEPFFVAYTTGEGKIAIIFNKGQAIIRERRKGRGIQAARLVNLINKFFGYSDRLKDKTMVLGRESDV